jgi:flagellin
MSISILNNPASLAAQNQLGITNSSLQKTLYQLSSGSRINTGADDAAGLAVANGLMANITALTQSARNANDGVGKLQVADGALAQVTSLLNRAITLATEAANGTLSDAQRAPLQAEFASIQSEINRIGATTNFNGQQVFLNTNANTEISSNASALNASSTLGGVPLTTVSGNSSVATTDYLQAGTSASWHSTANNLTANSTFAANETITFTVSGGVGTAGGNGTYTWQANAGGTSKVSDLVAAIQANAPGLLSTSSPSNAALVVLANGHTVTVTDSGATLGAGTQTVTGAAATFTVGTNNPYTYTTYGASNMDNVGNLINAINADGRYTAAINSSGQLAIGYGTVQEPVTATTGPAVTDFSGHTEFTSMNTTAGAIKTFVIQPHGAATATTFYDQGGLTVGALMSDLQAMGLSATLNGNGDLVVADPNNPNNAPTIAGSMTAGGVLGSFAAGTSQASVAAATDIYLTDDSANVANTIAVTIGALSASNMNGGNIASDNLSTQSTAQAALTDISAAINDVAALRGTLGASVNRLQSASNVINNNIQNLTSAQDQIMAADIPSTVANMAKYSILEQTGVASLAQANQMQQLVLKLLQ